MIYIFNLKGFHLFVTDGGLLNEVPDFKQISLESTAIM